MGAPAGGDGPVGSSAAGETDRESARWAQCTPSTVVSHTEEAPSPERRRRLRAWAASIVVLGLMLFAWPFLRTPLLGIGPSYAHLLGAWALIVAGLALLARALRPDASARGGRA